MVHILTFQNALNYGAVLQCAALYKTISEITECDVIDYRAECIESTYKIFSLKRGFKKNVRGIILAKNLIKKRESFEAFLDDMVCRTKLFRTYGELESAQWDENDIFCVGSDQVWNSSLTGRDRAFCLYFAPKSAKKISYAASFGKEIDTDDKSIVRGMLEDFKSISVRESTAYKQLCEIGISCTQSIDPVYLLNKNEWETMSEAVPEEETPYVLVYLLQKSEAITKKAVKYAKENRKKLVFITELALNKKSGAIYIEAAKPQNFIRYFFKADTVFTNSFHGLSLSIILNKPFFFGLLEGAGNTNSRLLDVVAFFGLENQNCMLYDEICQCPSIDYADINKKIEQEQYRSKGYLRKAILY